MDSFFFLSPSKKKHSWERNKERKGWDTIFIFSKGIMFLLSDTFSFVSKFLL